MAETLIRSLRDGCFEGEHAPALCINDSLLSPLGSHAFRHFLTALLSHLTNGRSQASGIVLVSFDRSRSFYLDLFKRSGFDSSLVEKWVRILDCYSDPLGWKDSNSNSQSENIKSITICKNVKDIDKLLLSVLDLGKGFGLQGKDRFAVAIDSVSQMLRHASLPSVSGLLSNLRSNGTVSSIFWLIHSDLHEPMVSSSFEYIATMIASLDPNTTEDLNSNSNSNSPQNYTNSKFNIRIKRRNGRVKLVTEELIIEKTGVKFAALPSTSTTVSQNLLPKVQFNLQLSDKERMDRANVVLPFEHQGKGQNIQIYDGRRSLTDSQKDPYLAKSGTLLDEISSPKNNNTEKGEIHYIRDSDDERPDSDEDPDDDLDI